MTNTGGATTPAGWYTDPGGSGHLRWWDGAAWTAHLAPQPTPAPAPVVQQPMVQQPMVQQPMVQQPVAQQPYVPFQNSWNTNTQSGGYSSGGTDDFARPAQWNTVGSWLLAFSGLLSLIFLFIGLRSTGASIATPYGTGVVLGSSAIAFLISLFFAEADRRKLRALGYLKVPSLWWMLLAPPLVYLIVRTVVVWGEVRKGIAPLITFLVVNLVGGVAAGFLLVLLLPGALGIGASTEFASSLQTGLDQKGGHFTVTCPPSLPTTINSTFTCTAVDSKGTSHSLSIEVIQGADGQPTVKLLSVIPAITG
jgi:hypothetical protein